MWRKLLVCVLLLDELTRNPQRVLRAFAVGKVAQTVSLRPPVGPARSESPKGFSAALPPALREGSESVNKFLGAHASSVRPFPAATLPHCGMLTCGKALKV